MALRGLDVVTAIIHRIVHTIVIGHISLRIISSGFQAFQSLRYCIIDLLQLLIGQILCIFWHIVTAEGHTEQILICRWIGYPRIIVDCITPPSLQPHPKKHLHFRFVVL